MSMSLSVIPRSYQSPSPAQGKAKGAARLAAMASTGILAARLLSNACFGASAEPTGSEMSGVETGAVANRLSTSNSTSVVQSASSAASDSNLSELAAITAMALGGGALLAFEANRRFTNRRWPGSYPFTEGLRNLARYSMLHEGCPQAYVGPQGEVGTRFEFPARRFTRLYWAVACSMQSAKAYETPPEYTHERFRIENSPQGWKILRNYREASKKWETEVCLSRSGEITYFDRRPKGKCLRPGQARLSHVQEALAPALTFIRHHGRDFGDFTRWGGDATKFPLEFEAEKAGLVEVESERWSRRTKITVAGRSQVLDTDWLQAQQRAADAGDPRALCNLALLHERSEGYTVTPSDGGTAVEMPKNATAALECYRKAAEAGRFPFALYRLGEVHWVNRASLPVGERNLTLAVKFLKEAIASGSRYAVHELQNLEASAPWSLFGRRYRCVPPGGKIRQAWAVLRGKAKLRVDQSIPQIDL